MTDQANGKADAQTPPADDESFGDQLSMMRRAFMTSPLRNTLFTLAGGMLAIILATAFGQVLLNRWNEPFYDALSRRDLQAFMHQLLVFFEIAGGLLVLNLSQTWLSQMLHLKLREGLTRDLIGEWMRPRRAFRLANAGAIGVNPDQRMHEDAHHLADLSAEPRHRAAAIDHPACQLRRRAVVIVVRLCLPCLGAGFRDPGLHGVGGGDLCRDRVVGELAGRPPVGQAEWRSLRARGRTAVFADARQRAYRRDFAGRRRGGRATPARVRPCDPCCRRAAASSMR